eukprot:CAMPEP_0113903464 /NCGR_PEP_ID=MMETSP0780_2-20120614/22550_1 /TAXON_ID=652834 /ORGANISM="Palpitomonas bilix" /LENGTH=644 /DNA_ID=CAMNT_0000896643 /DNA_START=159 /DNA_END=2094 /DNA_ORIENTATION=+ /assembly_acc=CAM_ASM_000599
MHVLSLLQSKVGRTHLIENEAEECTFLGPRMITTGKVSEGSCACYRLLVPDSRLSLVATLNGTDTLPSLLLRKNAMTFSEQRTSVSATNFFGEYKFFEGHRNVSSPSRVVARGEDIISGFWLVYVCCPKFVHSQSKWADFSLQVYFEKHTDSLSASTFAGPAESSVSPNHELSEHPVHSFYLRSRSRLQLNTSCGVQIPGSLSVGNIEARELGCACANSSAIHTNSRNLQYAFLLLVVCELLVVGGVAAWWAKKGLGNSRVSKKRATQTDNLDVPTVVKREASVRYVAVQTDADQGGCVHKMEVETDTRSIGVQSTEEKLCRLNSREDMDNMGVIFESEEREKDFERMFSDSEALRLEGRERIEELEVLLLNASAELAAERRVSEGMRAQLEAASPPLSQEFSSGNASFEAAASSPQSISLLQEEIDKRIAAESRAEEMRRSLIFLHQKLRKDEGQKDRREWDGEWRDEFQEKKGENVIEQMDGLFSLFEFDFLDEQRSGGSTTFPAPTSDAGRESKLEPGDIQRSPMNSTSGPPVVDPWSTASPFSSPPKDIIPPHIGLGHPPQKVDESSPATKSPRLYGGRGKKEVGKGKKEVIEIVFAVYAEVPLLLDVRMYCVARFGPAFLKLLSFEQSIDCLEMDKRQK